MNNTIVTSPFQSSFSKDKFMCISDSGLQAKSKKGASG